MLTPDILSELQDLRYLTWSRARESSGTAGSYLKSYDTRSGRKIYYKLSCFDSLRGITGHESVNELIVDRLLTLLGIEHLSYQLIHAMVRIEGKDYETWLCASENFREPGESKLPLDDFYDLYRTVDESPLDFCLRNGWGEYIFRMILIDFLILNRDRHGANIEILRDWHSGRTRPAPLFDHGLSLVYSCADEAAIKKFDVMADLPVQCFVGSHSAAENLRLVPSDVFTGLKTLEERDRSVLLRGLECTLSKAYLDKIWDLIWSRWQYLGEFFSQQKETMEK